MSETLMPSASMQSICRSIFLDMRRHLPFDHFQEDLDYLFSRMEREGNQFLFIVLPKLGKAIEKSLVLEEPLQVPQGWRLKKGSRLPLFLNTFFCRVWKDTGDLQPYGEIDVVAVGLLRQLTLIFSKVEGVVGAEQAEKAVEQFRARTESDPEIKYTQHTIRARQILFNLFSDPSWVEPFHDFERNPWGRHGPGAVADKSSPARKWCFYTWPGYDKNIYQVGSGQLQFTELDHQPMSRVAVVPKDFRGPRIICIEPKENQFAQQGLMDLLYRFLTHHPLSRGSISFRNTTQSERLCFRQDAATIDLKDASDNLSLRLCRFLYPRWVFSLLTRYRTRTVSYKDMVWSPRCFATMGNALCFPVETMTFWALAYSVTSLYYIRAKKRPPFTLRVYGDDIIVPKEVAPLVIEELGNSGLIVNLDKTCTKTLVKESCGEWVIKGTSQRLVKVKSTGVSDLHSWLQFMDYSVHAQNCGFLALSETMRTLADDWIDWSRIRTRYNRSLQRLESRLPRFVDVGGHADLDGWTGLYAWFVHNDVTPSSNGARKRVKWRWVPRF